MKCPFCTNIEDRVVDSREARDGNSIRRRRECLNCKRRFTSYERIDEIPYMVIKKDGRREPFDRQKILAGLMRASEKRPIPSAKLEAIVNSIEKYVHDSPERERPTGQIGETIMRRLKELDKVAYVRFASVYLEFEDVSEFMSELKNLVKAREIASKTGGAKVKKSPRPKPKKGTIEHNQSALIDETSSKAA
ncbi:MAG: transcriptional repressor NrdR [Pyrinomonadaceae bacterium]|nr:transcriptional repressor NrdR [Pyrinomonadaceae bacterium]